MREDIAKLLHEKSEDQSNWDNNPLSLRDRYSGRGMYGRHTWAVSGEEYVYTQCVIDCVVDILEDNDDLDRDAVSKKVQEFLKATLGAATDSMGMGVVWY